MFRLAFLFLLSSLLLTSCKQDQQSQNQNSQNGTASPQASASQESPKEQLDKGTAFLTKMEAFVAAEDYEGAQLEANQASFYLENAVKIDPNYSAAAAPALARAYYYCNRFKDALEWSQKASDADPSNPAYFKMKAMAHFNLGNIPDAQESVAQSISLDGSEENRQAIVKEMLRIGMTSFDFGSVYIEDGYPQKGSDYQKYGLALYRLAFDLDGPENKEVARQIVNWAKYLEDEEVVKLYEEYLK